MLKALAIGTSFGGLEALKAIIPLFPIDFPLAVFVVLHIGDNRNDSFIKHINSLSNIEVKEAEEKELVKSGTVYFAPPNYHLLVDSDFRIALSDDARVHHSRPSIDVLFESVAWQYKHELIGVLLTGLNQDGATGLKEIQECGGITIVENPDKSTASIMPSAAIHLNKPNFILDLDLIPQKIIELIQSENF